MIDFHNLRAAGFDGEWELSNDYSDVTGDHGIKMKSAGTNTSTSSSSIFSYVLHRFWSFKCFACMRMFKSRIQAALPRQSLVCYRLL
jgi:hypothetical protein